MALLFDLKARCICFACVVLLEIAVIIFLYQFNKNPFFRMRVEWLIPRCLKKRTEIELIARENVQATRTDTQRSLK